MNISDSEEKWQVEVGGQIYEASFEELAQWIDEGALLPLDKVRRGNLRWIEAQKVPGLRTFFNNKECEIAPPVLSLAGGAQSAKSIISKETEYFQTVPVGFAPTGEDLAGQNSGSTHFDESDGNFYAKRNYSSLDNSNFGNSNDKHFSPTNAVCNLHAETAAEYFCETCSNGFCRACPKSYGGNVKICPFCGAMCQTLKSLSEKDQTARQFQTATSESFGAADFTKALKHPFKYKPSLFFGALMFAFFTIGQSAAAIGGFVMLGAALFCALGANMLTFGVLANTIEKFSGGNLEANFMPDFEDFSIWDDVVHPFFLSIGVYLSSFGPFLLVCIVGVYLIFSSMTAQAGAMQNEIAKVPGTPGFDSRKAVEQSERVKDLTRNLETQNNQRIAEQSEIAAGNASIRASNEEAEFEQLEQIIQDSRKAQIESIAGKSPETERREFNQMIRGFLGLAAPLVVVGFLAFLWGAFYFPAACAVASYTRSFTAAINPLVGLDTIRRLGFDYVKILLMGFVIIIAAGIIGMILNIIFSPFEMPRMGNLPAKAFGSVFTFYFSIVFSSILGYALYKNSAKLNLPRG